MKPLTLFLMTRKGYRVLQDTVADYGHLIEEVVIGRDATLDDDCHDAIMAVCEQHGIAWRERAPGYKIRSRYAMAIAWRWLIDHPERQLIVFHDSLLPRYRGFNPLVSYLINGEKRIGVTAIFGARRYDAGDMLAQASADIDYPITIAETIERAIGCYCATARDVLARIARGETLAGTPQEDAAASYSLWRDEDDYAVQWHHDAARIKRFVDALGSPYKGASTRVDGVLARIVRAEVLPDVPIDNRVPGKVIWIDDGLPAVVCGEGLLRILELRNDATGESMLPLRHFRTRFS